MVESRIDIQQSDVGRIDPVGVAIIVIGTCWTIKLALELFKLVLCDGKLGQTTQTAKPQLTKATNFRDDTCRAV